MFNTRIIDEKERVRFNEFIHSHPKGHFLQTYEWGQVKKAMGWTPLPLVLEEDEQIRGALLILKRDLPIPGIARSIFYSPRGPVVDIDNEELCKILFDGAKRVADDHGAIFLKIDPDVESSNGRFQQILMNRAFKKNETGLDFEGVQPNYVFRLDITPSEENLLKNMHSKTRYNIRLAKKRGVKIKEAESKEDLLVFYSILEETAKRDKFLIRGYEYFEIIWDQMIENNYAKIFFAEYEGTTISASLALILGNKVWYLYGASSNEYRNVMPNYLIQWEMIRWAKEQGCSIYDFRGVSGDLDESNPLYGLYRFKKGFNGDLVEFVGEWDRVYSPFFYFLWRNVLPLYLKITRRN
ncbi:tRNA-dependent lipid II--amino acid ligase [Candidatus Syntrophocurvum alkaliphilum]|uniref:tRNA-dependent lipid II--amino acid ligase n=1 Tax=Candidatus Syntrophocurvum alkaliphilum TaxID=2293317 RepID=A0A6I6DJC0_9FIRM|nr:peptidoglycan bridge formation glycyltransferase FemA/FemB family protein [Candidatus Syntrophocurvum alkaliphilum]QGU00699.1 tRNA-dependent lipid II--amino acid ligase [Candidatus Syntrophocurvum alkaliphilum]